MNSLVAFVAALASVALAQTVSPGQGVVFVGKNDFCLLDEVGAGIEVDGCHSTASSSLTWNVTNGSGVETTITVRLSDTQTDCISVAPGPITNGSQIIGSQCVGGSQGQVQQWVVANNQIKLAGSNFCIDLKDGNAQFGAPVQLWACVAGNSNQKWVPAPPPPGAGPNGFAPGSTGVAFLIPEPIIHEDGCLTATSNTDGAAVVLQRCFTTSPTTAASQNWTLSAGSSFSGAGPVGTISTFGGSKCLDLTGGSSTNGNKLQIWSCVNGNTNQRWKVNGDQSISWAGGNKCVDNTNGNLTDGNRAQIWDCFSGNTNQQWGPSQFFP